MNYYQRTLSLMQDMEQRMKQENKDSAFETSRQVQAVLTQVRTESHQRNDLDKRFDELEMRVNGHLLTAVQKNE